MSKHTLGPWIITDGDEWTDSIHTDTEKCGIWTVAYVNNRRDEFAANRRLIAAAPDLLESLQDIYADLIQDAIPSPESDWWNKARAAIAKATGEQP